MGQATSSERRQRRREITARATRAIETETVRATDTQGVLALANPGPNLNRETVRRVRGQQMRRGGQPFTKADLVALLHALTGMDVLTATQMTCEDLRVAIRVRLYTADANPPATGGEPVAEEETEPNPAADIPDAPPAYRALPTPSAPPATAVPIKM